jgi:hypothetical protein
VITFGAIAAVVFAGISISRFGDLDPDTAPLLFALAVLGAGFALTGALAALLVSMSLAAASTMSVSDLVSDNPDRATRAALETLAKDPSLAPWGHDLSDFFEDVQDAHKDYQIRLKSWNNSGEVDASPALANRASDRVTALSDIQAQILETASYLRLQKRFGAARLWLALWLTLAAAGAATFVWVTGPAATESIPREPSTGLWSVPADEQDRIGDQLGGRTCDYDLDAVPVTILDDQGDGKEADIVTVAANGCRPARLVVDRNELNRTPVDIP